MENLIIDTNPTLFYNSTMTISQLLATMCADLSEADLNIIRKARGFSAKETASRDSFSSYFVSSIGTQEVMQKLTNEEIITLHLLHYVGEVDIAFFERLYGKIDYQQLTYTQQFKHTYDAVKKNLVRKGLLIMAESKTRYDTVLMERWRFAFPPEFAPYLPPILKTDVIDQPGVTSDYHIRKKLLQLVGGGEASSKDQAPIDIKEGSIYLINHPFTINILRGWQNYIWEFRILSGYIHHDEKMPTITEAIRNLLIYLAPNEWVTEKALEPILKIFCFGMPMPSLEKILKLSADLGILSRLKTDTDSYYRLAPDITQDSSANLVNSLVWLQQQANTLRVDLQLIPLEQLEMLNILMYITKNNNTIVATPNLSKLGRSLPAHRQSPLSRWLAENIPAYQDALSTVNERWGKTLLHDKILVAQVRDLSLRVQIERELGQNLIVLNEHFVAFSVNLLPNVEKVLKKYDFVIKTVKP